MSPTRRTKGDGGISWSETRQAWTGYIELTPRNGKRRRRSIQRKQKADVIAAIKDASDANRTRGVEADYLLDRFLGQSPSDTHPGSGWLGSRTVVTLRQSTRVSYEDTLRLHVRPFLGDRRVRDLSPQVLDDWLDDLTKAKRRPATIRYAKIVLRIALQRAVIRGALSANPLRELRVKGGTKRAPQALTAAQVKALLDHASPWMRVAILIGALMGLRRGEVCGLQWDDLDWIAGTLKIERSISAVSGLELPKTTAGNRVVPVPALVLAALAGHRRRLEFASARMARRSKGREALSAEVKPWIFAPDGRTTKPKHPRNFFHSYVLARKAAGLPTARFHDLRHTCATALLTLKHDPKAVSQMIGHADVRTTIALYHHPDQDAQRAGAQSIQKWLQRGDTVAAE